MHFYTLFFLFLINKCTSVSIFQLRIINKVILLSFLPVFPSLPFQTFPLCVVSQRLRLTEECFLVKIEQHRNNEPYLKFPTRSTYSVRSKTGIPSCYFDSQGPPEIAIVSFGFILNKLTYPIVLQMSLLPYITFKKKTNPEEQDIEKNPYFLYLFF